MKHRQKNVALLVETSNAYARDLLHGVVAFMREHRHWSTFLPEQTRGDAPPAWLARWKGDGIIARIENPRIAASVVASGLPVVDVSAANLVPTIPWVETDDTLIARAAAAHLLERGFRNFAFCGNEQFNWSQWRCTEFQRTVAERGFACHTLNTPVQPVAPRPLEEEWVAYMQRLASWIGALPKPVGIMACFDRMGQHILEACAASGMAVPDEVAVVGVDNDELLCELADPPLSSVAPDGHRTGFEAARLLDQMMAGQRVEPRGYRIEPLGVVIRTSSDVLAVDDPAVSDAARYIRKHACEGITVDDVVAALAVSRRMLESRFKTLIGRTLHDEIDRVQLERASELLRDTDLPLQQVAVRAGYRHAEYFCVVFKKKTGQRPSEYRQRCRGMR
ncbi:MAG TPA: DNA-binding transcriptional regulator [Tepidisphaeraceae bacterium]|jgi:LacI family transcriptional regulator|nr:DNA-binding transcriptional regulator [Tepidisphaeraceae bacterium]